ncbi:MAG: outer membrane protein assembly factor BamE [Rhodospirillales bacterium]|nr:outer membrane protein assembly factor BamE [Rhodospirillales bacterium]
MHGDPIDEVRLSSIVKGTHTRGDVAALFGSPSSTSPFTDGTWYYISARKEGFAFIADAEVERQIVTVRFDERGVVDDIRILTLENGRVVDVVDRETPSFGEDLSILQQFLGNVGRFEKDTTQQRQ